MSLTLVLVALTLGAIADGSLENLRQLNSSSCGSRLVTKKEIVKTISEEIGLTQLKTKEIVQKTFDAIVTTLVEDGRIELRNFGVFEVKKRAARKARNPRTGAKVDVDEKYVVTFKPGKEMEERVRQLEEKDRQGRLEAEQQSAPPQQQPYSPPQSNDSPGYPSAYPSPPNPPSSGPGDYGSQAKSGLSELSKIQSLVDGK